MKTNVQTITTRGHDAEHRLRLKHRRGEWGRKLPHYPEPFVAEMLIALKAANRGVEPREFLYTSLENRGVYSKHVLSVYEYGASFATYAYIALGEPVDVDLTYREQEPGSLLGYDTLHRTSVIKDTTV